MMTEIEINQLIQAGLFYFFALVTLVSAFCVIALRNPVHSVMSLILAFFSAAWLFIMLGAEFVAMILIIVYVGAVAVLFLFVIMMMDINFAALRQGFLKYLPAGATLAIILFLQISAIMYFSVGDVGSEGFRGLEQAAQTSNTHAIGKVLYTEYLLPFQVSGLILLVAMIGAIVLTLRHRQGVKRQKASKQLARSRKDSVKVIKVESGKGI